MRIPRISFVCILFLCLLPGFSAGQKSSKTGDDEQVTIRANVEMVSLPVVVTNRLGKRITDLTQKDFRVLEDGQQQEIAGFASTDEPLKIVLLLDTSGSTELELAKIQNAAIAFVNQLHPDDEVAVISFADDVTLQQDFSIDRKKNEYGIKKTRSGGWTVAYEAVWLALEDVLKPVKERKALVVFSDGVDTKSHMVSQKETLELAKETQATIYCVYYDTEADQYKRKPTGVYTPQIPPILNPRPGVYNPVPGTIPGSTSSEYAFGREYLNKLSEYSGGVTFDGMQDLNYAFAEIARELASQYSIGYYPTNNKHDGKFRKVEVKLHKPDLVARTKKGYTMKKDGKK